MGRLQKKKDPSKKKAQRIAKSQEENGANHSGGGASVTTLKTPLLKKNTPPAKSKSVSREPNIFEKSIQFLREVKIELKKVTWPSQKQTMGSTIVVLVLWMIISVFLGMVDFSLSSLMRVVLP